MAETRMLVERARAIVELGVNTVFVRDSVHEAVIHTLAQAGIGIITRVSQTDLEAISKLTGSPIYHMTEDADPEELQSAVVKENLIGDTRFVSIQANDNTVATLVLRGATRQTIDELDGFDDAIGVVAIAYNDREWARWRCRYTHWRTNSLKHLTPDWDCGGCIL